MATSRAIGDWKAVWWFPFMERRKMLAFLDTDPNIPLDLILPWNEYRWKV